MASTIQIKRGTTDAVAGGGGTSISLGEPLWHYDTGNGRYKLYVGKGATAGDIVWVGAEISNSTSESGQSAYRLMTESAIHDLVESEDTLAELNDTDITSAADAALLLYDTGTSTWRDAAMSGDATIGDTGALTIANDAISLAKMAAGTDGNLISYDTSGNPVAVATGNDGQVLTSAGSGNPPVFETPTSAAISTYSSASNNRLITSVDSTSVNSEANLTFDGSALTMTGTMFIAEQADAASDAAGFGQLWINTATPNELYFTDDAGTDHRIEANTDTNTWRTITAGGNTLAALSETLAFTAGSNITIAESGGAITITGTADTVRAVTAGGNTLASGETLAFTAGSNITITESAGAVTLAGTADTQLTQEEVEDFAGAMWTGNTETGITITYQDGTGDIDAVVSDTTVAGDSGSTGITPGDTLTIAGTANEITTVMSGDTLTVSLPDNVTIGGNLTVSGATTTVSSATLTVNDPLISMASGNTGADILDVGFYATMDPSGSQDVYAGLFRDANDSGIWKLFELNQAEPTTTINTSGTGYDHADLQVGTLKADDGITIGGTAIAGATAEQIEDVVGAMLVGTETRIAVSYDDSNGEIDFVVDDMNRTITAGGNTLATSETLAFTAGTNVTITESGGAVTINSSDTEDMGSGFVMEDDSGDEVTITENKEVKFIGGTGITTNWTDTSTGSDGDPYDLTITNSGVTSIVAGSYISISGATGAVTVTGTSDMGSGFVMEDDSGDEVTITEDKEVKFIGGTGITTNWTDVSHGSDGDPYDLTITNSGVTSIVAGDGIDISGATGAVTVTLETGAADNLGGVIIAEGGGIDVSYSSGTVTITGEDASTSNKGIASFASANFAVSSGAVSISAVDGGTY